jgi:hypothetical protein
MTVSLWRFDTVAHRSWSWQPFPTPRYRFDSARGTHRVRYGATTANGAARERYFDTGRLIPVDHADHHVATLTGDLSVLDLRREEVLDALAVDDRISTGRENAVWVSCQDLTDRVEDWWGEDIHAVMYRPRTTPETSVNVVFYAQAPLVGTSQVLREHNDLLDELVLRGFTIDF